MAGKQGPRGGKNAKVKDLKTKKVGSSKASGVKGGALSRTIVGHKVPNPLYPKSVIGPCF